VDHIRKLYAGFGQIRLADYVEAQLAFASSVMPMMKKAYVAIRTEFRQPLLAVDDGCAFSDAILLKNHVTVFVTRSLQ
jgi:hypothetical protein